MHVILDLELTSSKAPYRTKIRAVSWSIPGNNDGNSIGKQRQPPIACWNPIPHISVQNTFHAKLKIKTTGNIGKSDGLRQHLNKLLK